MSISPAKLSDSLSQLQQLFTKADTSGNGSLSKTEFAAAANGIAGLSGSTDADKSNLFASMDKNGDGELSKTELADGIKLAEQVQKALLMAQEIMSGSTLMNMIGGNTTHSDDSTASMFSSGSEDNSPMSPTNLASLMGGTSADDETTSTDPYTAMLQQLIAKYSNTDAAANDATSAQANTAAVNQTA